MDDRRFNIVWTDSSGDVQVSFCTRPSIYEAIGDARSMLACFDQGRPTLFVPVRLYVGY